MKPDLAPIRQGAAFSGRADWLATLVFPVEQEAGFSFGAGDLRSVLFSAVGLYFVLDGVRHAVGSVYQIFVSRAQRSSLEAAGDLWQRDPESLIRAVGGIAAGAFVLIGPARLREFSKRYLGRPPETDESAEPPGEV